MCTGSLKGSRLEDQAGMPSGNRGMLHFCTYFDHRYVVYGLALYRSLVRVVKRDFTLHVLCLDDITFETLERLDLPGICLIRLADLESTYPELVTAKSNRIQLEYYFTLTPAVLSYVLKTNAADTIAYVDADLYFYSDPAAIYEELGTGSVLLVPHRRLQPDAGGTYNVGLVLFRNDRRGRACLDWWQARCIEWCYTRYEDGKFADQGYLESWPETFPGVVASEHRGIGMAPWNAAKYRLSFRDDAVFVDSDPLVFYHFGNVRMVRSYLFTHDLPHYKGRMTAELKELVYAPYLRELGSAARDAGIPISPRLKRQEATSFSLRLYRELFRSRLLVLGPMVAELNYGPLGPILVRIHKWFLAVFGQLKWLVSHAPSY
jgi:hypothetical protein